MLKQSGKGNNLPPLRLPPLQKRIVFCLTEKGAQTINETTRNIQGHYRSTWTAFKSLEKKGLIEKVSTKEYRGREFPQFWLSENGIVIAMVNDAQLEPLLKNAEQHSKNLTREDLGLMRMVAGLLKVLPSSPSSLKMMIKGFITPNELMDLTSRLSESEKEAILNAMEEAGKISPKLKAFFNWIRKGPEVIESQKEG